MAFSGMGVDVIAWMWALACREDDPDAQAPVDHLEPDELEAATRTITALGPRLAGTDAEEDGRAVVEDLLRDAGLDDVTSEPFVWDVWQPGTAQVTVGERVFEAQALSPTPDTVDLSGTLAEGQEVRDQIALYSSDDVSRAEAFADALTGQAKAMIRVTEDLDLDGTELVEVGHTLVGSELPCVAVPRSTGEVLEAAIGQTVAVDVDANVLKDHTSYNVVGRIPGGGSRPIFLIAHYDSWHLSESAFDNALGIGALVVLARQLAQGPEPAGDIVFLATSGEEQGLQGSSAWVAEHASEVDGGGLAVTLDVVWSMEGDYFVATSDEALTTEMLEADAEEGVDGIDAGAPGIASDHVPFMVHGVPAIWATRWRDRHYHTRADTVDWLDFDAAAAAVRAHYRVIAEEAGLSTEDAR